MAVRAEGDRASVRLGPLRRGDAERCAELEKVLFPGDSPWSAYAFGAELASGAYYLGAYDAQGTLVGYGGLAVVGRPGQYEAEVHTIGVDPARQGQGVGAALLDALLVRADELDAEVFLEVRVDNERALALYNARDFHQIGVRKRYYQPSGADAYTMRRPPRSELGARGDGNEEVAG